MNVEGFGRLLEGSLGIEEPWYVEKVWFDDEAIELHISVGESEVYPVSRTILKFRG